MKEGERERESVCVCETANIRADQDIRKHDYTRISRMLLQQLSAASVRGISISITKVLQTTYASKMNTLTHSTNSTQSRKNTHITYG